jgi:hypothetical protein
MKTTTTLLFSAALIGLALSGPAIFSHPAAYRIPALQDGALADTVKDLPDYASGFAIISSDVSTLYSKSPNAPPRERFISSAPQSVTDINESVDIIHKLNQKYNGQGTVALQYFPSKYQPELTGFLQKNPLVSKTDSLRMYFSTNIGSVMFFFQKDSKLVLGLGSVIPPQPLDLKTSGKEGKRAYETLIRQALPIVKKMAADIHIPQVEYFAIHLTNRLYNSAKKETKSDALPETLAFLVPVSSAVQYAEGKMKEDDLIRSGETYIAGWNEVAMGNVRKINPSFPDEKKPKKDKEKVKKANKEKGKK